MQIFDIIKVNTIKEENSKELINLQMKLMQMIQTKKLIRLIVK